MDKIKKVNIQGWGTLLSLLLACATKYNDKFEHDIPKAYFYISLERQTSNYKNTINISYHAVDGGDLFVSIKRSKNYDTSPGIILGNYTALPNECIKVIMKLCQPIKVTKQDKIIALLKEQNKRLNAVQCLLSDIDENCATVPHDPLDKWGYISKGALEKKYGKND